MKDFNWIQKFEKIINLIEEARDIAEELKEDLIYDALNKIRNDLNNQYDDEVSK